MFFSGKTIINLTEPIRFYCFPGAERVIGMGYDLQRHEKLVLKTIAREGELSYHEIAKKTGLEMPAIERAVLRLESMGLAKKREEKESRLVLTGRGEEALKEGLPEEELLRELSGGEREIGEFATRQAPIALGIAKKQGLVEIQKKDGKTIVMITREGEKALKEGVPARRALEKVARGEKPGEKETRLLVERGLAQEKTEKRAYAVATSKGKREGEKLEIREEIGILTPEILRKREWVDKDLRAYDVLAPVKPRHAGRKHFAREIHEEMRRIWIEMGFREMKGPIIVPSFLNFDALYQPQDHPARELHDTFFLKNPEKSRLSMVSARQVEAVRRAHENGGDTGSTGWGLEWKLEIATLNVLRTHTTSVSAQTLSRLSREDLPAKFFSLDRCFRNETIDWKHTAEFYQTEGIVVDENATFRHLLGYLKEFYKRMGYSRVRFRPAYYPYTEMSVEPEIYVPERKTWVGLGGAGMFRPEVVKPLLGFEVPVLAWGLGVDRIVAGAYGIKDARELYSNNLGFLRNSRAWIPPGERAW